jgi:hypothetical protein
MLKLLAILQAKHGTKFFVWEFSTLLCFHLRWTGHVHRMEGEHVQGSLGKKNWEDQDQYTWIKLMETRGKWVYYCGRGELQVEKRGGNSYLKPRIFLVVELLLLLLMMMMMTTMTTLVSDF